MIEKPYRKLPIGLQSFQKLIEDGFIYVDKTEHVYNLTKPGGYYFLSRPRRFGKSLFLSTLKAFYEGKRELFEGLAITQHKEVEWNTHPVMYLDLSAEDYSVPEGLPGRLNLFLCNLEEVYGKNENETSFGTRFEGVIQRAVQTTGQKAVILVDEYDKPLLETLGNKELQEQFRSILRGFYSALKSMDQYIQFVMLTGVTKFGKLNVFSGLNNLKDISMLVQYNDICGINEQELLSNFPQEINALAAANNLTHDECVEKLRLMYDGYHFEANTPGVYNPFSLLNTLDDKKFGSYWFDTATPRHLVYLLQRHNYTLAELAHGDVSVDVINAIDPEINDPIPVIYQSGYLTIKGYNVDTGEYTLGFPNREVAMGFTKLLMPLYIYPKELQKPFSIGKFLKDLQNGDAEQFIKRLKTLFADAPSYLILDRENHFQNVLWILCTLLGFYTKAEYETSDGRVDLVVKTPLYCYVMEFKYGGTAEEAMKQIEDKNYTLPFELDGQKVIKIGLNFSKRTKNIDKYIVKEQ